MRLSTAGPTCTLLYMWKWITVQIIQGRMVRKEATVTINKVTVSFLSVERTGPALGERGFFWTVEMIIAYETVRMRRERKEDDKMTYTCAGDRRKSRRTITDNKIEENNQLHKIMIR